MPYKPTDQPKAEKSTIQLYTTPVHILGAVISSNRQRIGMSQKDFARALRLKQSSVSRLERGLPECTVMTVIKVAKVVGVPASSILGFVEQYATRLVDNGVHVVQLMGDARGLLLMSPDQLFSLLSSYGSVTVVSNQKDAI